MSSFRSFPVATILILAITIQGSGSVLGGSVLGGSVLGGIVLGGKVRNGGASPAVFNSLTSAGCSTNSRDHGKSTGNTSVCGMGGDTCCCGPSPTEMSCCGRNSATGPDELVGGLGLRQNEAGSQYGDAPLASTLIYTSLAFVHCDCGCQTTTTPNVPFLPRATPVRSARSVEESLDRCGHASNRASGTGSHCTGSCNSEAGKAWPGGDSCRRQPQNESALLLAVAPSRAILCCWLA